ncbi:MAG: hypothetical protein ABEI80_02650 [Haloplanus sp.]
MPTGGPRDDPTRIVSVAVTVDDVVTALEANRRSDRHVVLRITPPFSGRMRARLHRPDADADTDAVHLDPATLVDDPPPYPTPDETADRLRETGEYSRERQYDRHTTAVQDWREAVGESIVDAVELPTADGHRVDVAALG